jgi:hypothetical protein
VSEDSSCARFLFSKRFCGAEALGYARTTEYMRGNYDLANAMAISGAAVTPAVFGNPFLVVIILAFNLRLGQWILNPTRTPGDGSWLDWLLSRRRPIPLLLDWWSHRNPRNRRYCFVTDGGHYDNLGLEALLERRCRLIIASDASADPDGSFEDLLKVLRRNTVHSGIRVSPLSGGGSRLGLEALTGARSTESSHSRLHEVAGDGGNGASRAITHARGDGARVFSHQHYFVARIEYPQKEEVGPGEQIREGYLIYLKPSLSGDEGDAEVLRYIEKGSEFPHDSTINQFYDESRFEAYRRLGYHIGMRVFDECFAGRDLHSAKPSLAAWHPRRHPAEAAQPDAKMA